MDTTLSFQDALDAIGSERDPQERQRHVDNLLALVHGMQAFGNQRGDPVRTVPACLGDRWSSLVMHLLSGGMLRYTELRRLICVISAEHDISQRMLTLKLRLLERDGLLRRTVTADVPPRVEYRLTELGHAAYAHFAALVRWAEGATAAIRRARETYDQANPDAAGMLGDAAETDCA